ncbi:Sec-independent protein translocase subunit TatB [Caldimonas thermodepolymerans]|jgi:sec-independent protein translocase protein TatB|uniref:Sec-independent protein translocase protein TatB n=1 Tax=Caldimonas thermodepolymerans TaxID=215580 RepID=A0A2S5T2V7_9BURK|nr:Sec-independent protein translocase protein TatB [Caldimonas thermodepolymerans]PPE69313.1 twin-arginine translocase subunit TatB [Caldimonas thermodepolymerans]QPC31041.1 Sec-independent protein translocase subunit TatB [Caldimonas thermodepolymerans]RDH96235.1 sec-independent protein translocase protein TatB [Caldimonas thermodepolymerans]TCP04155.1 sec-independent protein translocase protein TatB [Caldimonas thermodepolymerans]UZG43765.1 Sec-independent protein translocase protein TatB [
MIDFGFDKLALIGAVALIVIGPEKLPRVARTVGHLLGKAQRYVADVKAEVNRSIELEELKKMKTEFEDAARNVEREVSQAAGDFEKSWSDVTHSIGTLDQPDGSAGSLGSSWEPPPPEYKHPRKNWRLKRGAVPQWYKRRHGVRTHVQSGAARVARFRPRRPSSKVGP